MLILDAYNVLHCSHVLPARWAGISAAGLCQMIQRAEIARSARVVCDGSPPGVLEIPPDTPCSADRHRFTFGVVELIYAGGGADADSLIEQMIDAETSPRDLIVVSNDRRIQRAARRRRATAMGSETFLRKLADALRGPPPDLEEKPRTEPEIAEWLRKFGVENEPPNPADLETETERWLKEFGFADEEDNL